VPIGPIFLQRFIGVNREKGRDYREALPSVTRISENQRRCLGSDYLEFRASRRLLASPYLCSLSEYAAWNCRSTCHRTGQAPLTVSQIPNS